MTPLMEFEKRSGAKLDYVMNWAKWLSPISDTIVASEWVVPSDMTLVSENSSTQTATGWIAGGRPGRSYDVINRITTAGGRINEAMIRIHIVG